MQEQRKTTPLHRNSNCNYDDKKALILMPAFNFKLKKKLPLMTSTVDMRRGSAYPSNLYVLYKKKTVSSV